MTELEAFLDDWTEDANRVKPLFCAIYAALRQMDNVALEYKARPGVSHSLRASLAGGASRPLFVLVDVIDDEPGRRWLSLCFYADLVFDPEEKGDVVPGGLMGEDARCFDVEDPAGMEGYMLDRLREARARAGSPA